MDYKITIKKLVRLYAEQNELTPEQAHRLLSAGLWISVADHLPEKDGEYIVMIDGTSVPTTLFFDEDGFFDDSPFFADIYPFPDSVSDDPRVYYHVTHWMPLPAPPVL